MMRRFSVSNWCASVALLVLSALPVQAQVASLVFQRAEIRIESQPPGENDKEPPIPHSPLKYDIELRQQEALRLEYIHTLNTLTGTTGVLIDLDAPSIIALPRMNVYTPVDVLFVAEDGTIVQIMPKVVLGEGGGSMRAPVPIKALLFLKEGEAALRKIHPRDKIFGKMFAPAPAVQN